jgi:hypothetical protein
MLSIIHEVRCLWVHLTSVKRANGMTVDTHLVTDLCKYASNKNFSHLVILSEKAKQCDG